MKKALVLTFVLVLAGCSGGGEGGQITEPPGNQNPPPGGPPSTAQVQMLSSTDEYGGGAESHAFAPTEVTVARGGTVTWTNNSGFPHNVTFAAAGGAPNNIPEHSSGSNSRAFSTAGSYSYSCTIHQGMNGRVVVAN